MRTDPRSVVTATAVLTPLGDSVTGLFDSLVAGESGLSWHEGDETGVRTAVGVVDDSLIASGDFPSRLRRHADRSALLALSAVSRLLRTMGISQAALESREPFGLPGERVGVVWGSSSGTPGATQKAFSAFASGGRQSLKRIAPLSGVYGSPSATSAVIAELIGARGPNIIVNTECASGTTATALASMLIESGTADLVVCGGSDATLDAFSIAQVDLLGATHSAEHELPSQCSRPFDGDRNGFVPAEGASALVVESADSAASAGRQSLASVLGYGMSTNSGHLTQPDQDGAGLRACLAAAMSAADASAEDIALYSAHGTGTPQNDPLELSALESVLGSARFRLTPVQAVKANIGHTLAAAGAVEIALAIESLHRRLTPPILNCSSPIRTDARLIRNAPAALEAGAALSCSSGFGGSNAAVILGLLPDESRSSPC
ncbi:beta-ketoacyl-[acyl-carrier-protein] synthase family protein [Arthrobacter sp. UM1]|uniref:beta-ketoacyl-[acyl-carrier-protein] synthase family protein n=1 Tax=Arthrobacter sp. UM1 TaxID=2766776 RepID=UPI001CF68586|nr:beta-ketoacyl-[acyl-carrier-protein] synthase family protein [Arthrobacter sp. UM1]MCB4208871.1 beta-ketoacyl-[acyl-carrier-protein] synthase family protein [Arthrobacter sp. UM1]